MKNNKLILTSSLGQRKRVDKQPTKKKKANAKQAYFCGKDQKKVAQKLFYETTRGRPSNPTILSTQGWKVKISMACKPKLVCMFSFEDLCQKALGAADYFLVIGGQFLTVIVYGITKMTIYEINWL
jgi:predicted ATPase